MRRSASDARSADPIGGLPAVDPRWDTRFRHLTGLGNAAFRTGDDARADRFYREALAEAGCLLEHAGRESGAVLIAPMALTIAANNLAAVMGRAGAADAARAVSIEAVDRLIATADSAEQPIALRLNCLRHLRHALRFLAELDREQARPPDAAARVAERVARVAAEVVRVAELWRQAAASPGCCERHPHGQALS